jgi:hypothetical protein
MVGNRLPWRGGSEQQRGGGGREHHAASFAGRTVTTRIMPLCMCISCQLRGMVRAVGIRMVGNRLPWRGGSEQQRGGGGREHHAASFAGRTVTTRIMPLCMCISM